MRYKIAYQKLYSLRQSTAEILAAAVTELYPNIELKGAKVDRSEFSYLFSFPGFTPSFLEPIERKMQEIIKEKRSVETKTMVFASAKGYLEHIGLKRSIKPDQEYTFVEMGDFIDLASSYQVENTEDVKFFILTGFELHGRSVVEIKGTSFLEKKSLKIFKKAKKSTHSEFLAQEFFLNERGVTCEEILIQSWKSLLKKNGFTSIQALTPSFIKEYEHFADAPRTEIFVEQDEIIEENAGLFDSKIKTRSKEIFSGEALLISYLQFLEKWLNLLELEHFSLFLFTSRNKKYEKLKKVLTGLSMSYHEEEAKGEEGLSLFVEDGKQRAWELFELENVKFWIGRIISFERVLALLEGKNEDFWKRIVAQIDLYK